MASFHHLQQEAGYGYGSPQHPTSDQALASPHSSGPQRPNIYLSNLKDSLHLKSHETMSLPPVNPRKIPVQKSRKHFSPGQLLKGPRRPQMRKRFLTMNNGRVITRNLNINSKRKFLSGRREYDLKKDQSLGNSGNKKAKWGRIEEGKVSWEHLDAQNCDLKLNFLRLPWNIFIWHFHSKNTFQLISQNFAGKSSWSVHPVVFQSLGFGWWAGGTRQE